MATASVAYGAAQTLTITNLGALASDTSLNAGWASAAVDNTAALGATGSNSAIDVHLGGFILGNSVAPTAGKQIEIWSYGSYDGTTFTAGATGTEGTLSPGAGEKVNMRLLGIIPTDATVSHKYEFGPYSIAAAWGGAVPRKWGIYIVHNMGQALAGAANHEIKFTTINYTSA